MMAGMAQDHPIFTESIRRIRSALGDTGLAGLEQQVLERLIHSSGDLSLQSLVYFSSNACDQGLRALQTGAFILTDTEMAKAAVAPMARRTLGTEVRTVLEWAREPVVGERTRTSVGMQRAWSEMTLSSERPAPVVLIGSAPTALETLLTIVEAGATKPSLVIGMPVGFVGVPESKQHLSKSGLAQIRLDGTRGGAGLAGAAVNALLRAAHTLQAKSNND